MSQCDVQRSRAQRLERLIAEAREEVDQVGKETTDRACILLGAAMLERRLERTIDLRVGGENPAKLRKQLAGRGLSGLVSLARALGIVKAEWESELMTIAKMRNLLAHTIHAGSFKDERIEKECSSLREKNADTPRDKFLWTVSRYCLELDQIQVVVEPVEGITVDFSNDARATQLSETLAFVLTWPSVAAMASDGD